MINIIKYNQLKNNKNKGYVKAIHNTIVGYIKPII